MNMLKKIWVFLKTHWYLPIIAVVGVVLKSRSSTKEKIVDAQQKSEDKQEAAIADAEVKKKAEKQEIEEEYKRVVGALENTHKKQKKEFHEETKKEIKKLVKKHYNDPKEMSLEISRVLGLTHVKKDSDSSD
jgi:Na+-transporting NADH:ubiquinone oxidoreductase subunit NqrC